jgi:hypothetical protein
MDQSLQRLERSFALPDIETGINKKTGISPVCFISAIDHLTIEQIYPA